jgi:hypothetical protein
MMMRNFLRCRGCGNAFIARVAADSTNLTKFYVPCPHCHLPIRASAIGQDFETHRMSFDCDAISPDVPEGTLVVTINPYVPARYDSDFDQPVGAFSMITLHHLLGDDSIMEYFEAEGTAQVTIDEHWARVRRLFEYYLAEDWPNFDRVGSEGFEGWRRVATVHERTTAANQALGRFVALVTGTVSASTGTFFDSYLRKHTAALDEISYVERLRADRDAGTLATLQRSIFDLLDLFVNRFEMWKMGRLPRWVDPPTLLDDLTLFRDEFPEMRDLYQQAFELICKTLRYPIAAQNTVKRQNPDDFGDVHPDIADVPINKRPSNLNQFDRLANAHKVAYIALVPRWTAMAGVLENQVRNTIGHATVRHDLRTGRVVSDVDTTGVSYLDFLAKVFGMFELLGIALQAVRIARVTSSPDFQRVN